MDFQIDVRGAVRDAMAELAPALREELVAAVREAVRDRLVSLAEAAELVDSTPDALRKRIARGQLRAVRMGRSIRLSVAELMARAV